MLTCQTQLSAAVTSRLVDPLEYLRERGVRVSLAGVKIVVTFAPQVRRFEQGALHAYVRNNEWLLRLQLHVPHGQSPRSAAALLAAGKLAVKDGRYVRP